MTWSRTCVLLLLLAAATSLTGCKTRQLEAENERLWAENQELRSDLAMTRAAHDALLQENQQLRSRPIPQPQVIQQPPVGTGANVGAFADIPGVETERHAGSISVRVPGDVLFAPGKVTLRDEAKRTLDQIASVINRDHAGNIVRVEGYTDTDPIRKSGWKDNLELSLQRAAAVHRYLQQQGVNKDRLYAAGWGESKPRESKAKSRRVEIVVVLNE